jgi:thiamine pyrophosphokinase
MLDADAHTLPTCHPGEGRDPLLILNGRAPRALLERLLPTGGGHVRLDLPLPGVVGDGWTGPGPLWAADGGANSLWQAGLPATRVVGDLDSLEPEARHWHEAHGARVVEFPGQDDNDLEKALALLAAEGHHRCWVVGFEGGRLDMLLGLASLLGRGPAPALRLLGEEQILLPLATGRHVLERPAGERFSLLCLDPAGARLDLSGARWQGGGLELAPGCRGVSNRAAGGPLVVDVSRGQLLLALPAPWGTGG